MRDRTFLLAAATVIAAWTWGCAGSEAPAPPAAESEPDRWEETIQAFEARDKADPPPMGGVVFLGSSSIRLWDLDRWFPELDAVNRGFGGSVIADSTRYAHRVLIPLEPRAIVFYAGDNDIARGLSPEQVRDDFRDFARNVHGALPEARIIFISIKPSLKRWEVVERMREANRLIAAVAESDSRIEYLDVDAAMLGADGRPDPKYFQNDGLHLNDLGYELWTSLLHPLLAPYRTSPRTAK